MNRLVNTSEKRVRFGRLMLGLCFFCNPNFNLFDLLPDFIGCALILSAIAPAADVLPYFSDARDRFQKLLWVSLSKLPASLLMLMIYAGDTSQRSIISVFALTYAIIDLLVIFPAFRFLFDGLFYLGERFSCDVTIRREKRMDPATLPAATTLFFVIRAIGSALPELALVPVSNTADTDIGITWIVRYYPYLALLSFCVVLGFGIAYGIKLRRYFARLGRDGAIPEVVRSHRLEKLEYLERRELVSLLKSSVVTLTVGIGFGVDLIFDNLNVLPDPLGGILIFISMLMLRRQKGGICAAGAALFYTVASSVAYGLSTAYFTKYDYSSLYHRGEALSLYGTYLTAALVEMVAAVILAVAIAYVLFGLIPRATPVQGEEVSRQTRLLRRSLNREAICLAVLYALSAVATYANALISQYMERVDLDTDREGADELLSGIHTIDIPSIPWFWMLPLALALVTLAVGIHLSSRIISESEHRHLEE